MKEFVIKEYAFNDERLKQLTHFSKDYFDDLLERIREIRISKRRYNHIYAECNAEIGLDQIILQNVQNMAHLAITQRTSSELLYMGLTTCKKSSDGR